MNRVYSSLAVQRPEPSSATSAIRTGLRSLPAGPRLLTRLAYVEELLVRVVLVDLKIADAVGTVQLLYLSHLRRAVLDTLAVRDPAGFATWLDAGARAASDPRRYIQDPENGRCIEND